MAWEHDIKREDKDENKEKTEEGVMQSKAFKKTKHGKKPNSRFIISRLIQIIILHYLFWIMFHDRPVEKEPLEVQYCSRLHFNIYTIQFSARIQQEAKENLS
mgnify:CR=1 FL=1